MAEDRKHAAQIGAADILKQVTASALPGAAGAPKGGDEAYQSLRQIGGRAWQLHAATRAADHFIAQDAGADRITGSWLVACAVDLAEEVTAELDALARLLKDRPADGGLRLLRGRAHKLHAAVRAADHFLDQDSSEDRSTASWLVACALDLAAKFAAEVDDEASQLKRAGAEPAAAFSDVVAGRKSGAVRGAVG